MTTGDRRSQASRQTARKRRRIVPFPSTAEALMKLVEYLLHALQDQAARRRISPACRPILLLKYSHLEA
ncbi:MAG: hypothetical protein AW09_001701 [Candidatus Accumulibacter phosphatis]|uniref:Uncharacterized protein n=1 Tax=Candidatus Accumulibacter phosphatis TaxID=327160 RepID=A0A080LWE4_9PROT|nr:MAG: hypothetical protein AW09_001701 [Candidatus Accumulibacter phosphatis]